MSEKKSRTKVLSKEDLHAEKNARTVLHTPGEPKFRWYVYGLLDNPLGCFSLESDARSFATACDNAMEDPTKPGGLYAAGNLTGANHEPEQWHVVSRNGECIGYVVSTSLLQFVGGGGVLKNESGDNASLDEGQSDNVNSTDAAGPSGSSSPRRPGW